METPTQEFLEIKDIREGVVILKDNNIRGILMVSSMNFALKSDDEQSAIIYAFQSFLNSLDFSCQPVPASKVQIGQSRNSDCPPPINPAQPCAGWHWYVFVSVALPAKTYQNFHPKHRSKTMTQQTSPSEQKPMDRTGNTKCSCSGTCRKCATKAKKDKK